MTHFIHDTGLAPDWPLYIGSADYSPELIAIPALGETPAAKGAQLAHSLLNLRNTQLPIAIATQEPAQIHHKFPGYIRSTVSNLSGIPLPAVDNFTPGEMQASLKQILQASTEPLTVIVTGPATDIADLIIAEPELAKQKLAHIYMMGGVVDTAHNHGNLNDFNPLKLILKILFNKEMVDKSQKEWNFWLHPQAVSTILKSGIPFTLVPLDCTNGLILDPELQAALTAEPQSDIQEFIASYVDALYKTSQRFKQQLPLWDLATYHYALNNDIGRKTHIKISVGEDPKAANFGQIINDPNGTMIEVCEYIDRQMFNAAVIKSLRG